MAALRGKAPLVLYSTNTHLKYCIQRDFIGTHRVWCSPVFAAEKLNKYALGAGQAPSSDPSSIYKNLHKAVEQNDDHDAKIASQKAVLNGLAVQWASDGRISEADRDEIVAIVKHARMTEWRPLLFVIPYASVAERVQHVEREQRATSEPEFIVPDLAPDEFDIIEPAT